MRVNLEEKDIVCDLIALYDNIAEKIGKNSCYVKRYDPTKINCTTGVMDKYYEICEARGYTTFALDCTWLQYAPKASIESNELYVEIEDGFITMMEE